MSFYASWRWLEDHPAFADRGGASHFSECLDVAVVRVCPDSGEVEDDPERNTTTQVWLECGPWEEQVTHDVALNSAGATFEEAIEELAAKVRARYPNVNQER